MRPPPPQALGALLLALPAAAQVPSPVPEPRAPETAQPVLLDLPTVPPDELVLEVPLDGVPRRIALARHSVRADDARVRVWSAEGGWEERALPPVATYRGTVAGAPGTVVLASLGADGLEAEVLEDLGSGWSVRPADVGAGRPGAHLVRRRRHADHALPEACGVVDGAPEEQLARAVAGPIPAPTGRCLKLAEIAFEADFEYYQKKGATVAGVVAAIDAIVNQVDYYYARDVLITYEVTGYVVRSSPFYTPTSGGDLLDDFRAEWNANQGAIRRDMAHLMTAKPGSLIQYGGLAWVGVVCTSSAYGWSMDGANIVGHEVGHNWGAGHCHDPSPCNNMCGACFYVAPRTKEIIEAFRDSRGCLDDAGPYATPVPPYAHPEGISLAKTKLASLGPVTFDPLANDHDGNCEQLFLVSFDRTTPFGGTVRRSVMSGPQRRDQLVYTPPGDVFVGADEIRYVVADTSGAHAEGNMTIDVRSLEPRAYWRFDDAAGQVARDDSGRGQDATARQVAKWVGSPHGGGMRFNGVNQELYTNANDFDPPWTVTAWFKRLQNGPPAATLIDSSDGSLRTEQWFYTQDVGVTRFGEGDYDFAYTAPQDTWVHLAFVGRADETVLYVDGVRWKRRPVAIQAPMGPISKESSPLRGVLDDLRVYGYSMRPADIADLALLGGKAVAPYPADGGLLGGPDGELAWQSGLQADSHDLYLGFDLVSVGAADIGDPEYQGNFLAASHAPGGLLPGVTYFWRVDERVGSEVVTGNVWQFRLSEPFAWALDETAGTLAAETSGRRDGRYRGGPQLGQPGAAAWTGTSVTLDGSDDWVRVPRLGLATNELTITTWLRRDGAQTPFAGLVFTRSGSTVAGLNLGTANELRYHWNDDGGSWSWPSGLVVPNGQWVFAALVIRPGRATIYLGQGGVLSSAENVLPHGPEEFDASTALGRDPAGGRFFRGGLDDVRIHRTALSREEIESIFLGL